MRAGEQTPLQYIIIRAPVVYGPGAGLTHLLLRQARRGTWRTGVGSRFKALQWVHVDDLVTALEVAAAQPATQSSIVNVAGGELFSMLELLSITGTILDDPLAEPPELASWPSLRYDIRRAGQLLGYQPRVKLKDGLAQLVRIVRGDIAQGSGAAAQTVAQDLPNMSTTTK